METRKRKRNPHESSESKRTKSSPEIIEKKPTDLFPIEIWYEIFLNLNKSDLAHLMRVHPDFKNIIPKLIDKSPWPPLDYRMPLEPISQNFTYSPRRTRIFNLPDGSVGVGSPWGQIFLWKLRSDQRQVLDGDHKSNINNLIQFPNKDLVSSSYKDKVVCVWDGKTLKLKTSFYCQDCIFKLLPFENTLLISYTNGRIEIRNPENFKVTKVLNNGLDHFERYPVRFIKTIDEKIISEHLERQTDGNYETIIKIWNKDGLIKEINCSHLEVELNESLSDFENEKVFANGLMLSWPQMPDNLVGINVVNGLKKYAFILDLTNDKPPVFFSTMEVLPKCIDQKLTLLCCASNDLTVLMDWDSSANAFRTKLDLKPPINYVARILNNGNIIYGVNMYRENRWKIWDVKTNQQTYVHLQNKEKIANSEWICLSHLVSSAETNELVFYTSKGYLIWNQKGEFIQKIELDSQPVALLTLKNGDLVSRENYNKGNFALNIHRFKLFKAPQENSKEMGSGEATNHKRKKDDQSFERNVRYKTHR